MMIVRVLIDGIVHVVGLIWDVIKYLKSWD